MKHFFVFMILAFVSFACNKATKTLTTDSASKETQLKVNDLQFKYLSGKGKVTFDNGAENISSPVDFRMLKDSLIWLSARPVLGMEAVRILITADSVFIQNKLNGSMQMFSFEGLSKQMGVPLNFKLIEALVVGNMPLSANTPRKVLTEPEFFKVQQNTNNIDLNVYISRTNGKLQKIDALSATNQSQLNMEYADFKNVGSQLMPFLSKAMIKSKLNKFGETVNIQFQHQNIELPNEALSFPFKKR